MSPRPRLGPPAVPVVIAVLALVASAVTLALPPQPRDPDLVAPWLSRLDLDADGCIDRREFSAQAVEADDFALFDADADGCLGAVELEVLLTRIDPKWVEIPAH